MAGFFWHASLINPMGWGWLAAQKKYYEALENGNGDAAIYWATRVLYYQYKPYYASFSDRMTGKNPIMRHYNSDGERFLILAYELSGQFDVALERSKSLDLYKVFPSFDHARLLYKLGGRKKSFESYCNACQRLIDDYESKDEVLPLETVKKDIFFAVVGLNCIQGSRSFCGFADFHEFYLFMNEEYEKQNRPEKYAKVMEHLQDIDRQREEIMKKNDRPMSQSSRYDTLRQILANILFLAFLIYPIVFIASYIVTVYKLIKRQKTACYPYIPIFYLLIVYVLFGLVVF
jgi:hypothetical protein